MAKTSKRKTEKGKNIAIMLVVGCERLGQKRADYTGNAVNHPGGKKSEK